MPRAQMRPFATTGVDLGRLPCARCRPAPGALRPAGRSLRRTTTRSTDRFDVSSDGRRFLLARPAGEEETSAMTLVQNWPELLHQ